MKNIVLVFVVAFAFCTMAMASDIAFYVGQWNTDSWYGPEQFDHVETIIAETGHLFRDIEQFNDDQFDEFGAWVDENTDDGEMDIIWVNGCMPSILYPNPNRQPDGSCALNHTDVTPQQAQDLVNSTDQLIVVDVREVYEYCNAIGHIPGALNYPWKSGILQVRYEELPADRPILVVCRRGNRSNLAANFLVSKGYSLVYDMLGGMQVWLWETEFCVDSDDNSINYDLDKYPQ